MAEYIDKDELLKYLKDKCDYALRGYCWSGEYIMGFTHATDIVNKAPPLNVAIVKHGRWKEMHYECGILDGTNFDRCSVCGYERVFDDPAFKTVFKYCPNCGAKMDGTPKERGGEK